MSELTRISVSDAEPLLGRLSDITDEEVAQGYDAYARHISYLHADDYGGDWKYVPQFRPGLDAFAGELDRRNLERPKGPYLL